MNLIYNHGSKEIRNLPLFWFGALNEIALYLGHKGYSPFVNKPDNWKMIEPEWNMTRVPVGQEDSVDENFLPAKR